MLKVIIAGGRKFNDYPLLCNSVEAVLINYKLSDIEIVCGEASGADALGKQWALAHRVKVTPFPAAWKDLTAKPCVIKRNKYGEYNALAGTNRNHAMGDYADGLIAFWNGTSTGTKDMIDYANKLKLMVEVIRY